MTTVQRKTKYVGVFSIHHPIIQGVKPPTDIQVHDAIIRKFKLNVEKLKGGQLSGHYYAQIRKGWGCHFVMAYDSSQQRWDIDEICLQYGKIKGLTV